MQVNDSLIRTLGRWSFATLTSAVTTFLGLYGDPFAFGQEVTECGLRDVAAWQLKLEEPEQEATPAYIYSITAEFITRCPGRPEIKQAHAIAAMAAVDGNDAGRALIHFDQALPLSSLQAQFYYTAALLAGGEPEAGWDLRDQMVADWVARMDRNRSVTLDQSAVPGGTVYRVIYNALDEETGFQIAFVAVPSEPGWPATVTLGSDRQLSAFHRLRAEENTTPLRHIDLYRCTGRRLLARSNASLSLTETTQTAERSLSAYLSRPDTSYGDGETIIPCLWPERLLPGPPR